MFLPLVCVGVGFLGIGGISFGIYKSLTVHKINKQIDQENLKILGYIDGLLNKSRLTGIGTLLFSGAGQILTSSDYSGYSLTFNAIHGSDDLIPPEG